MMERLSDFCVHIFIDNKFIPIYEKQKKKKEEESNNSKANDVDMRKRISQYIVYIVIN